MRLCASAVPVRAGPLEHNADGRHSCASLFAQNGSNLLEIGSMLGHKSPASTKRYAHLVEHAPVIGHPRLDEKLRSSAQPLEEFAVQ